MNDLALRIVSLARKRNTLRARCFAWQNKDALRRSLVQAPDHAEWMATVSALERALEDVGKDDDAVVYGSVAERSANR